MPGYVARLEAGVPGARRWVVFNERNAPTVPIPVVVVMRGEDAISLATMLTAGVPLIDALMVVYQFSLAHDGRVLLHEECTND